MTTKKAKLLTVYTFKQFGALARKQPKGWLWHGLLPRVGIVLLVGLPYSGKTTLIAALVAAMSGSGKLAGRRVSRGSMILAALEHNERDLHQSLRAAKRGAGAKKLRIDVLRRLCLDEADQVRELADYACERGASVIVIDPFRDSTRADENRAEEVREYGNALRTLANSERLVILIHHTAKNGELPRGSIDFMALADGCVKIASPKRDHITLNAQHHGAESANIRLQVRREGRRLELVENTSTTPDVSSELKQTVFALIAEADGLTSRRIREGVHAKGQSAGNDAIDHAVRELVAEKKVENRGSKNKSAWVALDA